MKSCFIFSSLILCLSCAQKSEIDLYCLPLLVGEVTQNTAIFQARLTAEDTLVFGDIHDPDSLAKADLPGKAGLGRFEIATDPSFEDALRTNWLTASPAEDFIVKKKVAGLQENTKYYYRLEYGEDSSHTKLSEPHTFQTFPSQEAATPVDFVMVTGTHFERFYLGGGFGQSSSQGKDAYQEADKYEGFPGFETIAQMQPDFYIGNGDNVYYDHPPSNKATTQAELRADWHRPFAMPRMRKMFESVPTFWLKDDHDHRFDDSDTVAVNERHGSEPSHQLGVQTFIEQVPVTDPDEPQPLTYRTHRINKLLQIWMVEGRDYRSPNDMPNGPDKTIWGETQKAWLKQTLLASDATFKILVSPTPMVGPDDQRKIDNHTNPGGFLTEGNEFFQWLQDNGFLEKNFYIICGDRHWKYHSVHPSGFEEFSCGALVDQNSRIGKAPGEENSTDPEGKIQQPYTDAEASGGFLKVSVLPTSGTDNTPAIEFSLHDEYGKVLYEAEKSCKDC